MTARTPSPRGFIPNESLEARNLCSRIAEHCVSLNQVNTAISRTKESPQQHKPEQPSPSSFRRSVWFIVLIAFALRIAVIVVGHTYRINPLRNHFNFGWEMGRIARSIFQAKGFSSPTDLDTGPTAWAAPVYPYIIATVFKLFGLYTRLAEPPGPGPSFLTLSIGLCALFGK
jgi:hypothetical protein